MVVTVKKLQRTGMRWLPLLLWMAATFIVSDQPSQDLPAFGIWNFLVKKGAHFLSYAVMATLAWRVTRRGERPYLWAFLIAAAYAASDEWHQTFVPSRNGTLLDVLIDSAGAIMALLLIRRWQGQWFDRPL